MNRLLEKAPSTVLIDGVQYEINTDYRGCLFTIGQLRNPDFTDEEKVQILINNMYLEDPPNIEEVVGKALWFLRCGEEYKEKDSPVLCDFEQDSAYIYNAFLKANIDLDIIDTMHWWTFVSRFAELPESFFSRLVYLRSQKSKGTLTKEEKLDCLLIGEDVINIKEPETFEERMQMQRFKDYFQDE